jgi:hypothetical protein
MARDRLVITTEDSELARRVNAIGFQPGKGFLKDC